MPSGPERAFFICLNEILVDGFENFVQCVARNSEVTMEKKKVG